MADSSTTKLGKPYQEFPMFPHATGQWPKKIKGKMWYFGTWEDPDAALVRYNEWIHEIHVGRDPRRMGVAQVYSDTLTVSDLCNLFLVQMGLGIRVESRGLQAGPGNGQICLRMDYELHDRVWANPTEVRTMIHEQLRQPPELFPAGMFLCFRFWLEQSRGILTD